MDKILIKRQIFNDLKDHLSKKEMSLIIGPRQVGKTTLMNVLKEYLEKQGKKTIFLSLDFENDRKFFNSQNALIEKLKLEFNQAKGYVFLDEIQRKENAGLFLKGLYDMNLPYKFILSGSGSVELKEKVHESLAGRKMVFEMQPVSFAEFVNFATTYQYENKLNNYFAIEADQTLIFLNQYLNFGGYPRVILETNRQQKTKVINEIYQSYLEKDISYWLKVEKLDVFSSLVKILASQTSGLLNHSEIANTLGVSLPTVKNYLYFLEKTFIIQRLTPFFKNVRKEITKSPIVYFNDLGLRNHSLGVFGQVNRADDFGFLFQNFVFNLLETKLKYSAAKINFWRTKEKAEVDFVINFGQKIIPIEVKYQNFTKLTLERSLRSFIHKYQPGRALVVTKNFKHQLKIDKTQVYFLPFWELLNFEF